MRKLCQCRAQVSDTWNSIGNNDKYSRHLLPVLKLSQKVPEERSATFWTLEWHWFRHFLPLQLFFLRAFKKNAPFQAKINKQKYCRLVQFSSSKYTKMRLRLGFAPDPTGGAYSAPPDPLAGLRGHFAAGEGMKGKEMEGGKGKRNVPYFFLYSVTTACYSVCQ